MRENVMREMISLQLAMCLMILAGVVLKKTGIFGKTGQKNMTDLVIDFILPCSIVKSFMIEFSIKTLMQFGITKEQGESVAEKVQEKKVFNGQSGSVHWYMEKVKSSQAEEKWRLRIQNN